MTQRITNKTTKNDLNFNNR